MKATALVTMLILLFGPLHVVDASEPERAVFRVQIATEKSSRSHTVLFTLNEGSKKYFGAQFPTLKVLVLPVEAEGIPLRISLVEESGQVLAKTLVYYNPDSGLDFSLKADGLTAQGSISKTR